jgi:putative drug exporter of the RND superfamily
MTPVGPIGRLGRWTALNARKVFIGWALIALALGVLAPRAEHALSGAGWEASGSESVEARKLVDREFGGLSSSALMVVVHSSDQTFHGREFQSAVARAEHVLEADAAVKAVVPPRPGVSVSRDGRTAVIQAAAAKEPDDMVRAADDLKEELDGVGPSGIDVNLTGASGMWSDFNTANKEAMMKSELISWPVTLAIMVVAFGSLVAAGLPLMLTILL